MGDLKIEVRAPDDWNAREAKLLMAVAETAHQLARMELNALALRQFTAQLAAKMANQPKPDVGTLRNPDEDERQAADLCLARLRAQFPEATFSVVEL